MSDQLHRQAIERTARALDAAFPALWPTPHKNPNYDPDGPDDATNPYWLPRSFDERNETGAWVDPGGDERPRPATFVEIATALAEAGLLVDAHSASSSS